MFFSFRSRFVYFFLIVFFLHSTRGGSTTRVLTTCYVPGFFGFSKKKTPPPLFYYQVVTWKWSFPKKGYPPPPIKYPVIPGNPSFQKKWYPPPPPFWTCARSHRITPVVGWLVVSYRYFSKTAPRIFFIFCMEVHYYEGKKRARPFFREKSSFFPKWALMWYFRGLMAQNGPSNRVIPILKRLHGFFWFLARS